MMKNYEFFSSSPKETFSLGVEIGAKLYSGSVIALIGELGCGKTTLMKGIVLGSIGLDPSQVVSPTFCYLNTYVQSDQTIHHFDLYRLADKQEFLKMGFGDYLFDKTTICCLEWAEKIIELLPPDTISLSLSYLGKELRKIILQTPEEKQIQGEVHGIS